ncbi:hypothetical protein AB0L63_28110 [Nocardia sp. NPDC051990]|uniref:hypothetical protein n=1 Tax=Nocardia sp. NPDC051990 TaxID=3155285 RepID=UPI003447C94C
MSKVRVLGVAFAATAGILLVGSGIASAAVDEGIVLEPIGTIAPGEPNPNGTGSSSAVTDLVKALSTGSTGAKTQ